MAAFALESEPHRGFAQINVTPLVDVMLVLLIIFMIATPLMTQRLSLNFAHCRVDCPDASDPVTLSIKDTSELYWNGVAINRAELTQNLTVLAKQADPPLLTVRAQAHTKYAWVAQALTEAKNAGLTRISMEPSATH